VSAARVRLGVTLPQFISDEGVLTEAAQRAEGVGLDSIWVFDHLWPLSGGKERPVFEAWTTLAYLAARTERIAIGTLVTRSALRNPALLAHMATTVAAQAPGRLVVAVGSGDARSRAENLAFGYAYERAAGRRAQLAATVEALRDLPRTNGVPAPDVWVGGRSPATRALAGRLADGWNGWGGGPAELAADVAAVRAAAGARRVELSWGGIVVLGRDESEARELPGPRGGDDHISGGPERVAHMLAARAEAGVSHLIITFPDAGTRPVYELLAHEVRARL
jgi:alkanesulfonate monooxygenase SsuD/methylene tetrahydromethanopterin reductase-like flavin-dependent oxidoreductase (luciferase family)